MDCNRWTRVLIATGQGHLPSEDQRRSYPRGLREVAALPPGYLRNENRCCVQLKQSYCIAIFHVISVLYIYSLARNQGLGKRNKSSLQNLCSTGQYLED